MSSSTALRALSGYRRLFRARKKLFVGDIRALTESRFAIRAEFDKNRTVSGPPEHIEGLLTMIDEAGKSALVLFYHVHAGVQYKGSTT